MKTEFNPIEIEGATVAYIGRTGSRGQHRVYTVIFCERQYNVTPGQGLVNRIDEVEEDGRITRYPVDVSRLVGLKMIDLVEKYKRALKDKYTPE